MNYLEASKPNAVIEQVAPRPMSMLVDINLKATHTLLDGWGVPRLGALKPYDATLIKRLMYAAANGYVNLNGVHKYEQVSDE